MASRSVQPCLQGLPITQTHRPHNIRHTHTHTHLTALFPGLPRWAGTRKVKPIWILLKQETVSGSGIRWAICKLAPCSRQTTTPAPHHSVFYRPDALPAAQPTVSKHWRKTQHTTCVAIGHIYVVHVMPLINTKVHDSVCSTNNQTSRCSLCSLNNSSNNLVLNHQLTAEGRNAIPFYTSTHSWSGL